MGKLNLSDEIQRLGEQRELLSKKGRTDLLSSLKALKRKSIKQFINVKKYTFCVIWLRFSCESSWLKNIIMEDKRTIDEI